MYADIQRHLPFVSLFYLLAIQDGGRAKMIRNNALMNQMVNHFQMENNLSLDPLSHTTAKSKLKRKMTNEDHTQKPIQSLQNPEHIVAMMQSVLCKNFPSVPCEIITHDPKLNNLISKSIHQISKKRKTLNRGFVLDRITDNNEDSEQVNREHVNRESPFNINGNSNPNLVTQTENSYHVINSEDLSSFLAVQHTGYFKQKPQKPPKRTSKKKGLEVKSKSKPGVKNYWSHEKRAKKDVKEATHTSVYTGRKKLRKFYPHKMKYKDKSGKKHGEFREYSDEKLSMSVEVPDVKQTKNNVPMTFKVEPSESPVWRIDYEKHGVPNLNIFGYEDERLMGKIIKNGRNTENNVIADENGMQTPRKDVMHSDLYIKKNFARKNTVNMSSGD